MPEALTLPGYGGTFNCGIGIVAAVARADLEQVVGDLHAVGDVINN